MRCKSCLVGSVSVLLLACGSADPEVAESEQAFHIGGEVISDDPVPVLGDSQTGSGGCGVTATSGQHLAQLLMKDNYSGVICIPNSANFEIKRNYELDGETYSLPMRLRSGVTLRSERNGLTLGGRIYTTQETACTTDETPCPSESTYALFQVEGDDVRIEGLRIHGPSITAEKVTGATGIAVRAVVNGVPLQNVVIERNELSGWPFAAIKVKGSVCTSDPCRTASDAQGPRMSASQAGQILVKNNYLHNNVRDGLGYGVKVDSGAYAMIFGNLFDYNRHAVASDGRPYTGYIARYNYVLEGGHCQDSGISCYYNQHFDVHGAANDDGYGGIGGEYFLISQNTIRGDQGYYGFATRPAFYLRGEPMNHAYFNNNVVSHDNADDAVRIYDDDIDNYAIGGNHYKLDTTFDLGVGDFDADGRDDVFLTTGTAWFYSSAGKTEWRFLRNSTKRIAEVGLGDFDGDQRTDVFTRTYDGHWYSFPGGSGAPVQLNTSGADFSELGFGDFNGDGKTDVFRATGVRWYVSWSGTTLWDEVNYSAYTRDQLRFGDFDGDGRTDVFALANGDWSWSRSAQASWAKLNDALAPLSTLAFGDFNGDGRTDIATRDSPGYGWQYSSAGRSAWQPLRGAGSQPEYANPVSCITGNFDGAGGDDALRYELIKYTTTENGQWVTKYRTGRRLVLWSWGSDPFVPYSRHPMR